MRKNRRVRFGTLPGEPQISSVEASGIPSPTERLTDDYAVGPAWK